MKMEWEREDWKFMAVAARCLCLAPRLITPSAAVVLVTDTCSSFTVTAWKQSARAAAWLTASPSSGRLLHWPPARS